MWPLKVGENQHKNLLNLQALPCLKLAAKTPENGGFFQVWNLLFPEVYDFQVRTISLRGEGIIFYTLPKLNVGPDDGGTTVASGSSCLNF